MCIILFSYGQTDEYPLIFLANRDEFYDRPSKHAHRWPDHPKILAGRDMVAKGTWLGVSDDGRFAAVTNFRDPFQPKGERSRGDLVAEFLKTDQPAKEFLQEVEWSSDRYTGFNLLVGEINRDRNEIYYLSNRLLGAKRLESGLFGLSNHLLDTPWPKVEKGKLELARCIEEKTTDPESLFRILSDESLADDENLPETGIGHMREKRLSAIFIKTPSYGTRNSTILTFNREFEFEFEERVFA